MAEAGALPEKFTLKRLLVAARQARQHASGDEEKWMARAVIADLDLRDNIAVEARRRFMARQFRVPRAGTGVCSCCPANPLLYVMNPPIPFVQQSPRRQDPLCIMTENGPPHWGRPSYQQQGFQDQRVLGRRPWEGPRHRQLEGCHRLRPRALRREHLRGRRDQRPYPQKAPSTPTSWAARTSETRRRILSGARRPFKEDLS